MRSENDVRRVRNVENVRSVKTEGLNELKMKKSVKAPHEKYSRRRIFRKSKELMGEE